MARSKNLTKLLNQMKRMAAAPRAKLLPELLAAAHDLRATAKMFAEGSRDTGALIDSIQITLPGQVTPAHARGGSRVAKPDEVIVSVGDTNARHASFIEWGTASQEAQPFWNPAIRTTAKPARAKLRRKAKKIVRDEAKKP